MPSIGALKRTHGASTIENCVGVLIEDLNGSFGGDLSQSQMEELIAEITTGFNQNISLEGVYLAFKEVKYTQNFGKLNVNKVLKIVADQLDKACNYAGVLSHNKHLAIKESCSDVERNSVINKAANKMAKEMYDAGKLKTIKPIKK